MAGEAYIIYGGSHLGEVVTTDQTLAGMAGEASLLGGAGDDTLTGHADTEVLYGGAGDDVLRLVDDSFRRVDGGSGMDTLVLDFNGALDLTDVQVRSKVRGVEVVSLAAADAAVCLNQAAVLALVEARDNGGTLTAAGEVLLRLEGSSGMVFLSDRLSWTEQADAEGTADLWTNGAAKLLIDDGLLNPRNVLDTSCLVPAHGFIIQGDMEGDALGDSVSGAGDINGDGFDDLIVGASNGDDGGTRAGEAYVIYGKAGNTRGTLDTSSLAAADGFIIQGDVAGDDLGGAVSGAGDINGDGIDDLIVGASLGDDGEELAGEAYVIYGKAGNTRGTLDTTGLAARSTDGFIIQGDTWDDNLGQSVSGAGDINGDGIDDLIVGTSFGDDGGLTAGEAYVIYGKTGNTRGRVDTSSLAAADGFIIQGDAADDWLGNSVSGAGDINGDGLADLIVGAYLSDAGGSVEDNIGEAYVIYGKAGTDGTQFGAAVTISVNTSDPEDHRTMTITDDRDLDDSLVVRQVLDTSSLVAADGFIIRGDAADDGLGRSVSGAGDVNGDGIDDLIVGAPWGDDGGAQAGEAYIIYGKAGDGSQFGTEVGTTGMERQILDTTGLTASDGFIIQGDAEEDWLGVSVSGAGDVNGDGLADLIVGAEQGDDGEFDAGEAYIIYGKAGNTRGRLDTTGLAPADGFIIQGDAERDWLGWSVSGAGDVNGDEFDDLVVGAPIGDDGGEDAGEAYIIYGGAHLGEVSTDAQTLTGIAGEASLLGGAGDDSLVAHADTEVLYGGAGDDVLRLVDDSFRRVDGGLGVDTLELDFNGALDLTDVQVRSKVRGVEVVSLADAAAAVTLNQAAVLALVEARDNGGTLTDPGEALLRLEGVSSAMVVLSDRLSWTMAQADAEGTADLWTQGSAKLLIDDGLLNPNPRPVLDTSTLVPTQGFIIQGDAAGDEFGQSVSGAGDINGDGLEDLIVGARFGDDGGANAGEAYVIYGQTGKTRGRLDTSSLAAADGFIIQGDAETDWLGNSVSGAGDINGDGVDDLIVGARLGDDGGANAGEAYVIYGKTGNTRGLVDTTGGLASGDGFILQGDDVGDALGISVSGAGDVNGDGIEDLIVGARDGNDGGANAGEAYVIYGKTGTTRGTLDTSSLAAADGFIIQGDMEGDLLGESVSGAGDINGDGVDDLIVGARWGDDGGTWAGEAYVIYGKTGNTRGPVDTTGLAAADGFIIQGDDAGDELGQSVSGAGDVNGDGIDDLIVGARFGDDGGVDAGEAYVIYGKAGNTRGLVDTTGLAAADGFIIQGDAEEDWLGYSVSGAGDINGDGLDDLIVGAYLGDDSEYAAGEAYIIYGKTGTTRGRLDTTGLAAADGFIIQGDAEEDWLGVSVSGAGDINGNGFDDLLVGANRGDDGGSMAGEAYVVYGGAHLGEVDTDDQTLTGVASKSALLGGAGDDTLEAHADTEVLYGGAGDDVLELVDDSFRRVDGGLGDDTLVLDFSGTLSLTDASVRGKVRGVEVVSLADADARVQLNQEAVYALVEARDNGDTLTDAGEVLLRLEGSSGMVVLSDRSDWTMEQANAEGTADLWTQGSAKLLIDDGLLA